MDYRELNKSIASNPGPDMPSYDQKLREWRVRGPSCTMMDIRKAYLQVRIHPSLLAYQAVSWQGKVYVMERMGFGLSIAPKVMDVIVKFVTSSYPGVYNYVDDLLVPTDVAEEVKEELTSYGLPTKPAEPLEEARVLGLQVESENGEQKWSRRDGMSLLCPVNPTKRDVFKWCEKLTSHHPVCQWLRPACSYVKRLAKMSQDGWDVPIPTNVYSICKELEHRVLSSDPASGTWSVKVDDSAESIVWCDASDIALGVQLQVGVVVAKDQSWLRPMSDRRHINVAELDAVIKGLTLAERWKLWKITVHTDSKAVFGWLRSLLCPCERIRVSGLQEVLVERRLQIIRDLAEVAGMKVDVEWVPSKHNKADQLTRVPSAWITCAKSMAKPEVVSAVIDAEVPEAGTQCSLSLGAIGAAEHEDDVIARVVACLEQGDQHVPKSLRRCCHNCMCQMVCCGEV